jgi:hypothetical protein
VVALRASRFSKVNFGRGVYVSLPAVSIVTFITGKKNFRGGKAVEKPKAPKRRSFENTGGKYFPGNHFPISERSMEKS